MVFEVQFRNVSYTSMPNVQPRRCIKLNDKLIIPTHKQVLRIIKMRKNYQNHPLLLQLPIFSCIKPVTYYFYKRR